MSLEDRLLAQARVGTDGAQTRLGVLAVAGQSIPVLATEFQLVRCDLTRALAAVTELERLAKGGTPPPVG